MDHLYMIVSFFLIKKNSISEPSFCLGLQVKYAQAAMDEGK
jgi:hypothetical protein